MGYLRFLLQFPRHLSFGLVAKFFSSPGQTFFLSMYALSFKESLGFGDSFYNIIYSTITLVSAVTINFIGPLLDRQTSVAGVRLVGISLAVAALMMSVSHWIALWVLAIFLLRFLGQGMMGLAAQTAMIRWFALNRGKALGLTSIGFSLGEILFPLIIPLLIAVVGWRISWVVVSGLVVCATVILPEYYIPSVDKVVDFGGEKDGSSGPAGGAGDWTRARVFRDPRFYLLLPSMMILPMVATGLILNQDGIALWRGWDPGLMVRSFVGFGAGRLIFSLVAGPLVDRFSAVRIYSIFLIPVACAISLPLVSHALWVPFVSYLLLGLGQGLAGVTGSALWPEIYGTRHIASIKSFANTFAIFSTALGPGIISLMLETGDSFQSILSVFLILTVIAWIVGLAGQLVHHRYRNH